MQNFDILSMTSEFSFYAKLLIRQLGQEKLTYVFKLECSFHV